MKFSYLWLAELVPGLDIEPSRLERLITMKTAECEGVETYGAHFTEAVAVRVLSISPLPKGKNTLVIIEAAEGVKHQVVCGAPNVRPGMLAVWLPPGVTVAGRVLGVAVIEGAQSEGMLASGAELGINRDHTGVLELTDAAIGQPIPGLQPDSIIEIDNKSLTHRPDLWGHLGMAREVAAITGRSLRDPVDTATLPKASLTAVQVSVQDVALCPRYSALLLENIRVQPSPLPLQERLESVGFNSINNVVDITNVVLAELPQPMHAFDADKLRGGIVVRTARTAETLHALNGETYHLTTADLVIADEGGPIALAGIIGGAGSAVSEQTTRVVLESANFQATGVRLSSARHKLRTDASMRFEKSLDPSNTVRGLARAVALLKEISPEVRVAGGLADVYHATESVPPIELSISFVSQKLGQAVTSESVTKILESLGFEVTSEAPDLLSVAIPTWRATKDITGKHDLVEEVGRMIGYGEITPTPPLVASVVPPANPMRVYVRKLRTQLAAQGFTEVYNYSFVNEEEAKAFSLPFNAHIAVRNPIASEQTHLRASLLPGILQNIESNVRHFREFRIFEVGNEIRVGDAGSVSETPKAVAALYNLHGNAEDFFEAKRVLECALPGAVLRAANARAFEHPFRTAEVHWRGAPVGHLFELHPSLLRRHDIPGRAIMFEINLNAAQIIAASTSVRYEAPRKYPTSGFDLSVIAPLHVAAAQIEDELRTFGGTHLALLEFVRQYSGPPLADGQKSVSYHVEAGAQDRTLTAEEAGEIRAAMIDGMRSLGYELRV